MAQWIVMPKLGLTMKEGTLTRWAVNEGDAVIKGQVLFEVETDKITNEVEAPSEGVIRKILVKEGKVPVLEPVALLAGAEEEISDWLEKSKTSGEKAMPALTPKKEAPREPATQKSGGRIKASPKAKKLAKELGVDLATIEGTGPGGAIGEEDVTRAHHDKKKPPASTPAAKKAMDQAGLTLETRGPDQRVTLGDVDAALSEDKWEQFCGSEERKRPISTMRKVIADRMLASHLNTAPVNYRLTVDARGLIALKKELSLRKKTSYTELIVAITARALLDHPLLNARMEEEEIILPSFVHMGVAVALDDGLLVPVVRHAHAKPVGLIGDEIASLAAKAKKGLLTPDALSGGTFTVTNLGMFGMESFTPVIDTPQVAILGINAIDQKMVEEDGCMKLIPVLGLNLTADHRVVDGAVAAAFLARLKKDLEHPTFLVL